MVFASSRFFQEIDQGLVNHHLTSNSQDYAVELVALKVSGV